MQKSNGDNHTSYPNQFKSLRAKFQQAGLVKAVLSQTNKREESLSVCITASTNESLTNSNAIFQDHYKRAETIGQGANAVVRRCYRLCDDHPFAVKISQVEEEHLVGLRAQFGRLCTINHPNIVAHHAMYINPKRRTCHLVMDLVEHPSLSDYIYGKDGQLPLTETEIKQITQQMLEVIQFLHSKNICHRDIKPDNILYDRQNNHIKLVDFGVSKIFGERSSGEIMMTNTGTCSYKAPEIFAGAYTKNVDLWAAGVMLYEMVEKRLPFEREYLTDAIQAIIRGSFTEGKAWNQLNVHARNLLRRLLKPATERISAEEALQSSWFGQASNHEIIGRSRTFSFSEMNSALSLTKDVLARRWSPNPVTGRKPNDQPKAPSIPESPNFAQFHQYEQINRFYTD